MGGILSNTFVGFLIRTVATNDIIAFHYRENLVLSSTAIEMSILKNLILLI